MSSYIQLARKYIDIFKEMLKISFLAISMLKPVQKGEAGKNRFCASKVPYPNVKSCKFFSVN